MQVDIGDLSRPEIVGSLESMGFDSQQLHPTLEGLLASAFNLSLFAQIVLDAGESVRDLDLGSFRTRIDLLREVDEVIGRRVRSITRTDDYVPLINELARVMSDQGALSLPTLSVLSDRPGARDAMLTEGVLVEEAQRIRFLHESYFEYVYARQHVVGGRTAWDLVRDDSQDLIRRGQVRSVLALERDSAPSTYIEDLQVLLDRASPVRARSARRSNQLAWRPRPSHG